MYKSGFFFLLVVRKKTHLSLSDFCTFLMEISEDCLIHFSGDVSDFVNTKKL